MLQKDGVVRVNPELVGVVHAQPLSIPHRV